MKNLLILVFITCSSFIFSQNENNVWMFGYGAGLDFNSGSPVPISGMSYNLEGCASISDASGNLLFYSEGLNVIDKNHSLMPNGAGLLGHNSSTESAFIVKKPSSSNIYYLFTVDGYSGGTSGLNYSEVDMDLNGGNGAINSNKNINLMPSTAEKLTAIRHANGTDVWIICPKENSNEIYVFLITASGINNIPSIYTIGPYNGGTGGYFKASLDGAKIAGVHFGGVSTQIDLYDFNNSTGILSNYSPINTSEANVYGVEFSPNGNLLYVSFHMGGEIMQYDLTLSSSSLISSSAFTVATQWTGGALQLGPDNKIYHAELDEQFLSVINNPDVLGGGCSWVNFGCSLGSAESSVGLPTFIRGYIDTNEISITVSDFCAGSSTDFSINTSPDSLFWSFGDPFDVVLNTSTGLTPSHTYLAGGDYNVELIVFFDGIPDTINSIVTIIELELNLGNDTILCNTNLTLNAQNTGASYLWQDGTNNQTYTVSSSGTYYVEVNSLGCSISDTINVIIGGPIVDLGPDIITCDSVTILDAQNIGATYLWQDGSTSQTFSANSFGTFYVDVTVGNCSASDTIIISQGAIVVNLPDDALLCGSQFLDLNAENVGATYLWSTGETYQSINVNTEGTYWVEVVNQTCIANDTIVISYYQPNVNFIISDTIGCAKFDVNFTDQSTSPIGAVTSWLWSFGDGNTSTTQNTFHSYENSGVYNVTLQITTATGCQVDDSKNTYITIYDNPQAFFTMSPTNSILINEEVSFDNLSIDASNWNWNFGDNYGSNNENPTHVFNQIGSYTIDLVVSNEHCIDSTSLSINVEEELLYYIPNAFTPDGDKYNNEFKPIFTSGFDPQDYHLLIFDRWGEVIFESFNSSIGWNGQLAHKDVQDGMYVWEIVFGDINNDKKYRIDGHVILLR